MKHRSKQRQQHSSDDENDKLSIILSAIAREGGGKTHFGLTGPKPLHIMTVDPNTRFVVEQMGLELSDDSVTIHHVKMPTLAFDEREDVKEEAIASWDELIEALRPIAKGETDPMPRTVVFDTADQIYSLSVLATFGKEDQISPELRRNMMGPVNRRYQGVMTAIRDAGVNVVLLHRSRDVWAEKTVRKANGQFEDVRNKLEGPFDIEREGFKYTGNLCSIEVALAFDPQREGKLAAKYGVKLVRSTHRPAYIGKELWGREKQEDGSRVVRASFPYIAQLNFPSTTREEWE